MKRAFVVVRQHSQRSLAGDAGGQATNVAAVDELGCIGSRVDGESRVGPG
jgi:hypothetical protein